MPHGNKEFRDTPKEKNDEFDKIGKAVACSWMIQRGYALLETKARCKACDAIYVKNGRKILIEAECRGPDCWKEGPFRFETMHVPYRKIESKALWYFQCSFDGKMLGKILVKNVKASKKKWSWTKNGKRVEPFYDVPLDKIEFYKKDDDGKWIRAD